MDFGEEIPDQELLLEAYRKWGRSCTEYLEGDFAFAVWDEARNELFCARDQLGCRPLYFWEDADYFACSTHPAVFHAWPGRSEEGDRAVFLRAFASRAAPHDRTFYQQLRRLAPAHQLVHEAGGHLDIARYWELRKDEGLGTPGPEEAAEQFTELLRSAVEQRVRGRKRIGLEMSGGLDSSAVGTMLREIRPEGAGIHGFTHVLGERHQSAYYPFYDERENSRIMAEFVGVGKLHLLTGEEEPGAMGVLERAVEITGLPLIQLYPAFSDMLHRAAREQKVGILLSGFGGDECATSKADDILDEYSMEGNWKMVLNVLAHMKGKNGLREGWRLVRTNILGFKPGEITRYSAADLALAAKLSPEFRDAERHWKSEGTPKVRTVRELQKLRLSHEHVADRLEMTCLLAREQGIEYAYPMLDVRLIRFVYSLPPQLKFHRGQGRYLVRQALKGRVPEAIRLGGRKFGATIPNLFYRLLNDEENIRAFINGKRNGPYAGYIDFQKLEWQLDRLKDQKKIQQYGFGPKVFISTLSLLLMQDPKS
jgi:asparagine synthase (glutamine-hydrolysing)